MGSLVVKLDEPTTKKLERMHFYSDVDMLNARGGNTHTTGVPKLSVPMIYDVEAVKASVRNILMWRVGESVISP